MINLNLQEVRLQKEKVEDWSVYPFNVEAIKTLTTLKFKKKLTFFVGENGSGKSTLLEAIAEKYGLGKEGGSKNISFQTSDEANQATKLSNYLTLSWSQKILSGYFFRAESFFNVANYIDQEAKEADPLERYKWYLPYGGESLHLKSHGESFFELFENRFSNGGFLLMDEPEAALSPQRQLSFLIMLARMLKNQNTQIIIATHSPILLAFPDADILSFDYGKIKRIAYKDTNPYQIVSTFLKNPGLYLERILDK
jgi:predicted ATPase